MLQKWLLVFIIVGCTSLVFIICFPIDFYLYRRRKRMARERVNNMCMYKPSVASRAGQMRSYVSMDVSIDDYSEYMEKSIGLEEETTQQSRFVKLVNMFRGQKSENIFKMRKLSLSKSDVKSDVPTLTLKTERLSEFDRNSRSSAASKCRQGTDNQSFEHKQKATPDTTETGKTTVCIEKEGLNIEAFEKNFTATDDTSNDDRASIESHNESSTDSPTSDNSKQNDSQTDKPSTSSEDDDKVSYIDDYQHIDLDDDVYDVDDNSLTEDCLNQINNGNLSTLQIIHVRSNVSQRFFNNVQTTTDQRSKRHTFSGENIEHLEITQINNHHNQTPIRSLKSEPTLVIPETDTGLIELPEVFEKQDNSYSDYISKDDKQRHQKKRSLKRNNTVSPTNDNVDFEQKLTIEKSKKKRTKSEEVENLYRKESKKRKKKHAFQDTYSKSLPYLPDSNEVNNEDQVYIEP